jgi:hypothetical protein
LENEEASLSAAPQSILTGMDRPDR